MLKYFVGGEVVHKAPLPEECPALPVAQRLYDTVPRIAGVVRRVSPERLPSLLAKMFYVCGPPAFKPTCCRNEAKFQ